MVTTMQGISGAGRDLAALDIVENIIPYIPREEERVTIETRKILGRFRQGSRSSNCRSKSAQPALARR